MRLCIDMMAPTAPRKAETAAISGQGLGSTRWSAWCLAWASAMALSRLPKALSSVEGSWLLRVRPLVHAFCRRHGGLRFAGLRRKARVGQGDGGRGPAHFV